MEFLDINLTKDSSLLSHATHSPFYGRLKITILFSGFKNFYKKSTKQENSSPFLKIIFERKNEGRKPDKNSSLRRLEFMPRNLD
jgi:hypothetical protein